MRTPKICIAALSALTVILMSGAASGQTIDKKLQPSWAFMQKEMPGVPLDVLTKACAEGSVTVYYGSWTEAQDSQIEEFQKAFPCIKVNRFQLTIAKLRERFQSESRAGQHIADILQDTDAGALDKAADEKLFANYQISNAKSYPSVQKEQGFWYPFQDSVSVISWNTDLISEEDSKKLHTWDGVLHANLGGKLGVVDPADGQTSYLPWYLAYKLYGEDFFRQIGALKPRIYHGTNPAAASLAAGDIAVVFGSGETGPANLHRSGAPIRWIQPKPGISTAAGQAIPANSPHPNAAKLYQEFSFSEPGYRSFQKLGGAPTRLNYHDARPFASEDWYIDQTTHHDLDIPDTLKMRSEIVELFRKYVGK